MLAGFHDLKTCMVLDIAVMLHLLLMKLESTAFEMHVSCNPMAVRIVGTICLHCIVLPC